MNIYKTILIIMILNFTLQGCISRRYTSRLTKKYSAKYEFCTVDDIDTNYVVGKENDVRIFKGVYAGKLNKKGIECYNLQFTGLLQGNNRVLDIYIPVKGESFPKLYETDKMKEGKTAFLFYDYGIGFGVFDTILYPLFNKFNENYKDIDDFLKLINHTQKELSDTFFIVGLKYDGFVYPKSEITCNIYQKKQDGTLRASRITGSEVEAYSNVKLKYIVRNKNKKAIDSLGYGVTVLGDIVTAPFQLLFLAYLKIFGLKF